MSNFWPNINSQARQKRVQVFSSLTINTLRINSSKVLKARPVSIWMYPSSTSLNTIDYNSSADQEWFHRQMDCWRYKTWNGCSGAGKQLLSPGRCSTVHAGWIVGQQCLSLVRCSTVGAGCIFLHCSVEHSLSLFPGGSFHILGLSSVYPHHLGCGTHQETTVHGLYCLYNNTLYGQQPRNCVYQANGLEFLRHTKLMT